MSKKSDALLTLYEALLTRVHQEYQANPELSIKDLFHTVQRSKDYLALEKQATADELALVANFLKRDIGAFIGQQHQADLSYSPTVLFAENRLWHWLSELTDKTQIEWHEMAQDFKHDGHYFAGEIINQGQMRCVNCLHVIEIEFPARLTSCPECEGEEFIRQPLAP